MERHLKIGVANNRSTTLRVYFLWDLEAQKIVIENPRGNLRLQAKEESRASFLSSVKNVFLFSIRASFL